MVSGGSAANLIGLRVAAEAKAPINLRKEGLQSLQQQLIIYCSSEGHSSIQKAVELLGLGSNSLHLIPVDNHYKLDLNLLQRAIDNDRANGHLPIAVVGAAGTTLTGSFDNLTAMAEICQKENLWLHIDGAFGALLALSPQHKHLAEGMALADSVAFDYHKWMSVPIGVGCILIKDKKNHRNTFALTPDYLEKMTDGMTGGQHWFCDYGFELTREFKALKVWMIIKEQGIHQMARVIEKNMQQAKLLQKLIDASPCLEVTAPVESCVVCFRFTKPEMPEQALNAFNRKLLVTSQLGGKVMVTNATIGTQFCLRAGITNHRSQDADIHTLVDEITGMANQLLTEEA